MELTDLLRGKSAESFSPEQLQNKAHWRWQRDQFYAAFLLFDAAYQRALETRRQVDMATSRNRAAVTLFLSGEEPDEAVRRLNEVISAYANDQRERQDRHFVEWAATCLLRHEFSENPAGFAEAYEQVKSRCLDAGCKRYPNIWPQQEELAEMATEAEAASVLKELIPRLETRKPLPRLLKKKLKDWQVWLDEFDSP